MSVKKYFFLILLLTYSGYAQYSGGNGTSGNPWQITTTSDLIHLSNTPADWDDYFIQTTSISFDDNEQLVDWDGDGSATWDSEDQLGFRPIGNSTTNFTGTYNGQFYTINFLFMNRSSSDNIGLFGYVNNAKIMHLGLQDLNISGRDNVGGLIGYALVNTYGDFYVQYCYTHGILNGRDNVGGLLGSNIGYYILSNYSTVEVSGEDNVGGIFGYSEWSANERCFSTGKVSGVSNVGGFAGYSKYVSITESYSIGEVVRLSGTNEGIGSFVGFGHFIVISYCYASGLVNIGTNKGFVGTELESHNYYYNFFDTESTNQATALGAIAKTTNEMKNKNTFYIWGLDDDDSNWIMSSTLTYKGYPTLKWTCAYPVEPDIVSEVYQIGSIMNLVFYSQFGDNIPNLDGSIQLTNINAWTSPSWDNNRGFSPISGRLSVYNGQYNTISNLYINRPTSVNIGLFRTGGLISKLRLDNINITGRTNVGGLTGYSGSNGEINNCIVIGRMKGIEYVGGITGQNNAIINNCFTDITFTNSSTGSGIIGTNVEGTLNNSYSFGKLYSVDDIGEAIVGENFYGSVNNCFWDVETSGVNSSAGGTGKTTAQMKDAATFGDAGWSFGDIWIIDENINNGYPALWGFEKDNFEPTDTDSPADGIKNISHRYHLNWIAQNTDSWDDDFELDNDTDLDETKYWNVGNHDGNAGTSDVAMGFSPIGNDTDVFFGSFDGQDFELSNLYINRPIQDYVGFFGAGQSGGGIVQNIGLIDVDITGQDFVGGLFGADTETITNCFVSGSVSGRDNVGAIVGVNFIGDISNSYSEADVSGRNAVGGFCGNAYNIPGLTISQCFAIGDVTATGDDVGGFIGSNTQNDISNCYARGNVSANNSTNVGGFVGFTMAATYDKCYSTGAVDGNLNVGGFAGSNDDPSLKTNCFWDTQTSGQSTSNGGTGKTTAEMKSIATFTDLSSLGLDETWDFTGTPFDDTDNYDIWRMAPSLNDGYPTFDYSTPALADNIYINEIFNDETSGWLFSHFNSLINGLANATPDATVNISNYSFSGDVDMTGRTFVIGEEDFDITGNLIGGQIQVTNTGRLIMNDLYSNETKTFPITDGTYNYTLTINTMSYSYPDIAVRISNQSPAGSISSDFWDIDGPANLNATITLRIDKAAIAPKTLGSSSNLRYYDGTRYIPINGNNFSIEEFDTYYIITLSGVNEF